MYAEDYWKQLKQNFLRMPEINRHVLNLQKLRRIAVLRLFQISGKNYGGTSKAKMYPEKPAVLKNVYNVNPPMRRRWLVDFMTLKKS